jgi:hypothetical protein
MQETAGEKKQGQENYATRDHLERVRNGRVPFGFAAGGLLKLYQPVPGP